MLALLDTGKNILKFLEKRLDIGLNCDKLLYALKVQTTRGVSSVG